MSKLSARMLGLIGPSGMTLAAWSLASSPAHAFGGLWSSQAQPVQQTAQQVLFVDPPGASLTAIIRLQTAGPAQDVAWLVPVPGKPSVAVSSNAIFQRLDAVTSPQYWVEIGTEGSCSEPEPLVPAYDPDDEPGSVGGPTGAGLALLDQGTLGGYDYATLQVDATASDPAQTAIDWLAQNGYQVRGLERDVLSPYLRQGQSLIAFKLRSGADASSLRPIALTYEGTKPVLPIRAASVGAPDMGLVIWAIGPAQAVPENVAGLVLNEALIDWLSGRKFAATTLPAGGAGPFGPHVPKPRNYDALVAKAVEEAGGRGFVTELAQPASRYRELIWSARDRDNIDQLAAQTFEDGLDLLLMAASHFGAWDGFRDAVSGATTLPTGVTLDTFAKNPEQYRGAIKIDAEAFLRALNEKVAKPVEDAAQLLRQGPYLTRLFSVVHGAPTLDPSFTYNPDLGQINNFHIGRQLLQCEGMPAQRDAAWRLELPQGAVIQGRGNSGWPLALGALPANLKVVALSSSGPGQVLMDNTQTIQSGLRSAGHETVTRAAPQTPQHGESIGGEQSVRPLDDISPPAATVDAGTNDMDDEQEPDEPTSRTRRGDCSAGPAAAQSTSMPWLFIGALAAAVRLRRRPRSRS